MMIFPSQCMPAMILCRLQLIYCQDRKQTLGKLLSLFFATAGTRTKRLFDAAQHGICIERLAFVSHGQVLNERGLHNLQFPFLFVSQAEIPLVSVVFPAIWMSLPFEADEDFDFLAKHFAPRLRIFITRWPHGIALAVFVCDAPVNVW